MSKPASDKQANQLHAQLVEVLTEMVQVTEEDVVVKAAKDSDDEDLVVRRKVYPSPAVLAVARAVLKDNAVTMAIEEGNALDDLDKAILARQQRRKPTAADEKAALQSIGSGLLN